MQVVERLSLPWVVQFTGRLTVRIPALQVVEELCEAPVNELTGKVAPHSQRSKVHRFQHGVWKMMGVGDAKLLSQSRAQQFRRRA